MNHYSGTRRGGTTVLKNGKPLSPARSKRIWNHSPTGFEWGYGGSGPAQLALAMMLEEVDQDTALRLYQSFKWQVIARLPDEWELDSAAILAALDGIMAADSLPPQQMRTNNEDES